MALVSQDDFIALPAMGQYRALISEHTRGYKASCLLSQHLSNLFLELVDSGIITINVIANFDFQDAVAHFLGGVGDSVRPKINKIHICITG
jgi:hypothetical protein